MGWWERFHILQSDAGLAEVVVEGPYTGRPPETGDETIVLVAR